MNLQAMPHMADIEASGLGPQSFPIEIAWSTKTGEIRSRLIRPEPDWHWWEPAAEQLHHISRHMLEMESLPPTVIAEEMNRELSGEILYFDGGDYDRRWLSLLFRAAGMRPGFKLGDFDQLLVLAGRKTAANGVVAEALARRDLGNLPLHRAGNDVKLMQLTYVHTRALKKDCQ